MCTAHAPQEDLGLPYPFPGLSWGPPRRGQEKGEEGLIKQQWHPRILLLPEGGPNKLAHKLVAGLFGL